MKATLCLCLLLFTIGCVERKELGSKANPIKISLVPGQDVGVLMENGNALADFLKKETEYFYVITVPTNFITVVETFGTKRTDMALMNSFGYLLAHEKYGAEVKLVGTYKGRDQYWGQIITANPKIKKLEDIKGKKFAFVDPASTSGFLLPSSLFKKNKIEPKETVFAGKHDSVVTMVYQNRVDAGATYHTPAEDGVPQDARKLLKTAFPDVFEKVRILQLTDPIPSDPVVFAKDMPPEMSNKIIAALIKFSTTDEGKKALKDLYHLDGFKPTTDSNYDPLREMLKVNGKSIQDLVK